MRYFIEAIDRLVARYPEMKENTAIAILGGHSEEVKLTLPSYSLGYVMDLQTFDKVLLKAQENRHLPNCRLPQSASHR